MKVDVTLLGTLRRSPARMGLHAALPLLLAAVQLVNGALTELALWVSVAFAAAMCCYVVVYTRYHLARERLDVLESGAAPPAAD